MCVCQSQFQPACSHLWHLCLLNFVSGALLPFFRWGKVLSLFFQAIFYCFTWSAISCLGCFVRLGLRLLLLVGSPHLPSLLFPPGIENLRAFSHCLVLSGGILTEFCLPWTFLGYLSLCAHLIWLFLAACLLQQAPDLLVALVVCYVALTWRCFMVIVLGCPWTVCSEDLRLCALIFPVCGRLFSGHLPSCSKAQRSKEAEVKGPS